MIKNDPGKSVIHAVVDVVAGFALAPGFADDSGDGGGGGGHDVAARFRQNLDVRREEAIDLGIYFARQRRERFDVRIIRRWESTADIQNLAPYSVVFLCVS